MPSCSTVSYSNSSHLNFNTIILYHCSNQSFDSQDRVECDIREYPPSNSSFVEVVGQSVADFISEVFTERQTSGTSY